MSLQYISDSTGETTGVFIPINEWNELKDKYQGIEEMEADVPQWHIDIVRKRLAEHDANPDNASDFNEVMDKLEKKYSV